jgi:hypothetical protein
MKRIILLSAMLIIISNMVYGQFYIGYTPEDIIGNIQRKATMITKNYSEDHQVILSWVENGTTKWVVYFDQEKSYKAYIIPLYESTLRQWYEVINSDLPKASGRTGVWISYTKTGAFQLRFVYFPSTDVKCFEVTRTNEY